MTNENQNLMAKISVYIQAFFQVSISICAVLVSYLAWNTDAAYKTKQAEIALVDRSQKLDVILSEMYEVVRDIDVLRNDISIKEALIQNKYIVLFDPNSDKERRSKVIEMTKGYEDQLFENYKEISHLISVLRMKYGIYFPVLQQQFLGTSNPLMVAPTEEYDAWVKLREKMYVDAGQLIKLDFCVNYLGLESVFTTNTHIEACQHLKVEKLNFPLGGKVPVYTALEQIIQVNGDLLQKYADASFGNQRK
ncbi:hypothetical protein Q4905_002847 [Vibrio alginolyticus]|uniref:hypothetical protein n=3 Tax=Vibrio harveyi group TaxID=717610 RepID=UPI0028097CA0|nr:hypothetical protein [Vibrio alginolyticus]MDF5610648.1 hypothetical protein [Vibrio parahaemolyticus]